jgi:hypothetical protein
MTASSSTSLQVEEALLAIPAVVGCYLVSGGDDFLIEAAVPDLAGSEKLLLDQVLAIPGVTPADPSRVHWLSSAGETKHALVQGSLDFPFFWGRPRARGSRGAPELADWKNDHDRSGHGRHGAGRWRAVRAAQAGRNLP